MSDESKTFDVDGTTSSTFEDIDSTADTLFAAHGDVVDSRFRRIRHAPAEGRNWTRVGALAGIVGVVVAVVFGIVNLAS